MLGFVQNHKMLQIEHASVSKIPENHAENENFHPKSSLVNIELGDTQDSIFS